MAEENFTIRTVVVTMESGKTIKCKALGFFTTSLTTRPMKECGSTTNSMAKASFITIIPSLSMHILTSIALTK